jgi:hypothetical protein
MKLETVRKVAMRFTKYSTGLSRRPSGKASAAETFWRAINLSDQRHRATRWSRQSTARDPAARLFGESNSGNESLVPETQQVTHRE